MMVIIMPRLILKDVNVDVNVERLNVKRHSLFLCVYTVNRSLYICKQKFSKNYSIGVINQMMQRLTNACVYFVYYFYINSHYAQQSRRQVELCHGLHQIIQPYKYIIINTLIGYLHPCMRAVGYDYYRRSASGCRNLGHLYIHQNCLIRISNGRSITRTRTRRRRTGAARRKIKEK